MDGLKCGCVFARSVTDPPRECLYHQTMRERLTAAEQRLAEYKRELPHCEKHTPRGGTRSGCLICALEKLSYILSRIGYACEEPNEYETSLYDVDCDEDRVLARVREKLAAAEQRAKTAETGRTFALRHAEVRRQQAAAAEQRASEAEAQLAHCGESLRDEVTARLDAEHERDLLKRAIAPVWPLDKPIQQYVELCARYRAKETKVVAMHKAEHDYDLEAVAELRERAEAAEAQLNTCLDALANAAFGWPDDDTRRTYNPDEVQQRAAAALRVVAAIEALTFGNLDRLTIYSKHAIFRPEEMAHAISTGEVVYAGTTLAEALDNAVAAKGKQS